MKSNQMKKVLIICLATISASAIATHSTMPLLHKKIQAK